MAQSSIEWTQMTWNPTTGCDKISEGCRNCYAEIMAKRLQAMGQKKYENAFRLTLQPEALNIPYTWKKPKIIFVNSMSDLFHKNIPIEYILQVFKVMNETPHHTYQVLTKRAEELLKIDSLGILNWTRNIWMGVTVENNKVKERITHLKNTSAKTKFISFEPLLSDITNIDLTGIDWAIVGGESGYNARSIKKEWILNIKTQCDIAGTNFFFKQWGSVKNNPYDNDKSINQDHPNHAKGGCLLEGKYYKEIPESILNNEVYV